MDYLVRQYKISERRACKLVEQHRSTQRYAAMGADAGASIAVTAEDMAGITPSVGAGGAGAGGGDRSTELSVRTRALRFHADVDRAGERRPGEADRGQPPVEGGRGLGDQLLGFGRVRDQDQGPGPERETTGIEETAAGPFAGDEDGGDEFDTEFDEQFDAEFDAQFDEELGQQLEDVVDVEGDESDEYGEDEGYGEEEEYDWVYESDTDFVGRRRGEVRPGDQPELTVVGSTVPGPAGPAGPTPSAAAGRTRRVAPGAAGTGVGAGGSLEDVTPRAGHIPREAVRLPAQVVGGATRLAVGTGAACVASACSVARYALRSLCPLRRHRGS